MRRLRFNVCHRCGRSFSHGEQLARHQSLDRRHNSSPRKERRRLFGTRVDHDVLGCRDNADRGRRLRRSWLHFPQGWYRVIRNIHSSVEGCIFNYRLPRSHLISLDLTWSHLISLDLTWSHLISLDLTRSHLISLDLTWSHSISLDLTWSHLISLDLTWSHLISLDLTRSHLISLDLTWSHLISLDLTWSHLISLDLTRSAMIWNLTPTSPMCCSILRSMTFNIFQFKNMNLMFNEFNLRFFSYSQSKCDYLIYSNSIMFFIRN